MLLEFERETMSSFCGLQDYSKVGFTCFSFGPVDCLSSQLSAKAASNPCSASDNIMERFFNHKQL